MASEQTKRGVFPGLEFFTTLGDIAEKATQDIQQINRELTQPSAAHDLQVDNFWEELHIEYNTAYNQAIQLQHTLSEQHSVADSLDSFHSMISWIKVETQRVEKQLQQFGYQPDEASQYEYNLPLNPQQQEIYEEQQNNNNNNNNNKVNHSDNNEEDHNKDEADHNPMDIDEDEDNDLVCSNENDERHSYNNKNNNNNNIQQAQESDLSSNKDASHTLEPTPAIASSTNTTIMITKQQSKHKKTKIIPGTPRTPDLDDKFKLFYKNIRGNKENKNQTNRMPAVISTIASSNAPSVAPQKYVHKKCPETPVLKFDMNAIRKKCGLPITNLDDSFDSMPRLASPKVSLGAFSSNTHLELNNEQHTSNKLAPITPNNISLNSDRKTKIATPITVSSFSVKNANANVSTMSVDEVDQEDGDQAILYLTEQELSDIPSWITSHMGSVQDINKKVDILNNALKTSDGIITKAQVKDLIGQKETQMILLLTRTNRLKSDWCQGNSIYCIP